MLGEKKERWFCFGYTAESLPIGARTGPCCAVFQQRLQQGQVALTAVPTPTKPLSPTSLTEALLQLTKAEPSALLPCTIRVNILKVLH